MMHSRRLGSRWRTRCAALSLAVAAFSGIAQAGAPGAPDGAPALSVSRGRLDGTAGVADVGGTLRTGATYGVAGLQEARLAGPAGASVRALPGSRFSVVAVEASRVALRLDEGVLADAAAGDGTLEVVTPAAVVRGERATLFVRVLARGVYVEHQQGSRGTVQVLSRGHEPSTLAVGTFRMLAFDAGDASPSVAPAAAAPAPAPAPASAPAATPTDYRVAVPAAVPRVVYGAAPPCPPPPCAPPPCGACEEWVITSDVPVPTRADDAGRPPLGSALGQPGCCGSCCTDTMCNKIPYVHYVEGLVCDVTTYKVGCTLVTIRPASRVRVHRLPDGGLQIWAPNIGKDLALIELNDNQFAYIGEDGFLVLSPCGTVDYFRGLVHLYTIRDRRVWDNSPTRHETTARRPVTELSLPKGDGK